MSYPLAKNTLWTGDVYWGWPKSVLSILQCPPGRRLSGILMGTTANQPYISYPTALWSTDLTKLYWNKLDTIQQTIEQTIRRQVLPVFLQSQLFHFTGHVQWHLLHLHSKFAYFACSPSHNNCHSHWLITSLCAVVVVVDVVVLLFWSMPRGGVLLSRYEEGSFFFRTGLMQSAH